MSKLVLGIALSLGLLASYAASPALAAANEAQFTAHQGDEAVYSVKGMFSNHPKDHDYRARFEGKLRVLAMGDDPDSQKLSRHWDIGFKDTPRGDTWSSPVRNRVYMLDIGKRDRRFLEEPDWPIDPIRTAPMLTLSPLHVGQQWRAKLSNRSAMYIAVDCRVASEETMAGLPCLCIDMTPPCPTPYWSPMPYKLEERSMLNGFLPDSVSLCEFHGRVWVAKDTGWVVRLDLSYKTESEFSNGLTTNEASISLVLDRRGTLSGKQYEDAAAEIDAVDAIERQWLDQRGTYSELVEASGKGERMIAEFRKSYPKSIYAPAIDEFETLMAVQRRYAQNNRKMLKP